MNNPLSNLPPFYIGQKVVANRTHSKGKFRKGDEFIIKGITKKCCVMCVDIGIASIHDIGECSCGRLFSGHGVYWFGASNFTPSQEQAFPSLTYSKVVEKESELISLN